MDIFIINIMRYQLFDYLAFIDENEFTKYKKKKKSNHFLTYFLFDSSFL